MLPACHGAPRLDPLPKWPTYYYQWICEAMQPYVQMLGIPGSGKSTIESILNAKFTLPDDISVNRSSWVLVYSFVYIVSIVCTICFDWRTTHPLKFISLSRKLRNSLLSPSFTCWGAEGSLSYFIRMLSVVHFATHLFRFFGPTLFKLDKSPAFFIVSVDMLDAVQRVGGKPKIRTFNRLFLEKEFYRKRFKSLVDVAEHTLMIAHPDRNIMRINTSTTPYDKLAGAAIHASANFAKAL